MSCRHGTLMALCIAMLLAACGRKAAVKPPEDAAPQALTRVAAANVDDGVRLTWERPRHYVDGSSLRDLGGFEVWRSASDAGTRFVLLTTMTVDDRQRFQQAKSFSFVDKGADSGKLYQYYVVSFTIDRYASAPSNLVSITRENPKKD